MSNIREHQEQLSAQDAKSSTRYNRHVNAALRLLSEHARAATGVVNQQQFLRAQQQVLCDLVLHQKLFADTLGPLQQQRALALLQPHLAVQRTESLCILQNWGHGCSLCTAAQLKQEEEEIHPGAAGPEFYPSWGGSTAAAGAAAAAAASQSTRSRSRKPRIQQPLPQIHFSGPLPNSYVSRLLLSATAQQVLQAQQMTARCWQQAFAGLMPQLLLLLETASRHQPNVGDLGYTLEPHSTAVSADVDLPHGMPWGSAQSSAQAAAASGAGLHDPWAASGAGLQGNCMGSSPCWPPSAIGSNSALQQQHQQPQQPRPPDHPLGTCPVLDLAQLLYTVDSAMTLQLLALLHNPLPLLQALVCSYSPGRAIAAGMAHWEMVAQRLQLSEDQEVQLSVCHAEYQRMANSSRQLGASLAPDILAPSLSMLLLGPEDSRNTTAASGKQQQKKGGTHRQPGKQQQLPHGPRSNKRSRGSKASKNASSAASDESTQGCDIANLQKKLQKYLQLQQLHLVGLVSCVANTLSPVQLATSFVASYPFAPDFLAIAVAASSQLSNKQEQRLDQLQQSILQRDLGINSPNAPNPTPSPALTAAPALKKKPAPAEPAKPKTPAAAGAANSSRARARDRRRAGSDTSAASPAAAAAGGDSDSCKQQSPSVTLQEGDPEPEPQSLLDTVTKRHVLQRASDLLRHQEMCLCDVEEYKSFLAPPAPKQQQQQQQQASFSHLQQLQQQHVMEQQIMQQQQMLHEQMMHEQMMHQHHMQQQQVHHQQMQQESQLWLQDMQQQEDSIQLQQQQQDQDSLLLHHVLSAAHAHWEQAEQQQQEQLEAMHSDAQHTQVDVFERNSPVHAACRDNPLHALRVDSATDLTSAHVTAALKQRPVLDLSEPYSDMLHAQQQQQQQQQLAEPAAAMAPIKQQQPAVSMILLKQQQEWPMQPPDTGTPLQDSQKQQQQMLPTGSYGAPVIQQQQQYSAVSSQLLQQLPSFGCQSEPLVSSTLQQPCREHSKDKLQEPWCSVTVSAAEHDPFMDLDFLQSPVEPQSMFAAAMNLTNLAACPVGEVQQG